MKIFKSTTDSWLPTFPAVAVRVLELFADENVAVVQLAQEIKLDPFLTAKLLQMANSPLYRSKREISTLEHAISWLGKSEVAALVLGTKMSTFISGRGSNQKYFRQFWMQSFVQGCAMNRIAECSGRLPQGEAYICGLLLDFGKLVLLDGYSSEYGSILDEGSVLGTRLPILESARLGITHAEISREVLQDMGLPERYSEVAGKHETPFAQLVQYRENADFDMISAAVASSAIGDFFCGVQQGDAIARFEQVCSHHLGMSEDDLDWIVKSIRNDIEQKSALYAIDPQELLPIGQLVGHANSQLEKMNWRLQENEKDDDLFRLAGENKVLRNMIASLEEKACKDSLTGVFNRDYFNGRLRERISAVESAGHPFALVVVDIDDFKSINDGYGHLAGDVAISWTARLIEKFFSNGLVARIGGDEFVAMIDIENEDQVRKQLQQLCSDVEKTLPDSIRVDNAFTISAGAVICDLDAPHESLPIQIFDMADKAMYASKKLGGNGCTVISIKESPETWNASADADGLTPRINAESRRTTA